MYLQKIKSDLYLRIAYLTGIIIIVLLIAVFIAFFFFKVKKDREKLANSLHLNEILIREVHHRIKNNYQIIISMLRLNSKVQDESVEQYANNNIAKINSMARVHELFFKENKFNTINTKIFFEEIIQTLKGSLDFDKKGIQIKYETVDQELNSDKVIILGMIINELVVNSYKYAFQNKLGGAIHFELQSQQDLFIFRYSDGGNAEVNLNSKGMGITLIFLLVKQMKATASFISEKGFDFEIRFKD